MQEISLPVTLAVLGAALLHAGWNALLKSSSDKQLDTVAISVGAGIMGLAVAAWLPPPAEQSWPWLAASTAGPIPFFALLSRAYRLGVAPHPSPLLPPPR